MRQNVPAWQGFLYRNLSNKLGIRPAIIKILADRGVETEEDIREFLEVDQSKVSDGSELTDMEKGVSIIQNALAAGKHIRIMGGCGWRNQYLYPLQGSDRA